MRAHCLKCTMGFRVEAPLTRKADFTRCQCGVRFWHVKKLQPEQTIVVGVLPEDIGDLVTEDVA